MFDAGTAVAYLTMDTSQYQKEIRIFFMLHCSSQFDDVGMAVCADQPMDVI